MVGTPHQNTYTPPPNPFNNFMAGTPHQNTYTPPPVPPHFFLYCMIMYVSTMCIFVLYNNNKSTGYNRSRFYQMIEQSPNNNSNKGIKITLSTSDSCTSNHNEMNTMGRVYQVEVLHECSEYCQ